VGSERRFTADLEAGLAKFITEQKIKSILDIPCGDLNWVKHLLAAFPDVDYIGSDIAPNLIKENKANFPHLKFKNLDVSASALPVVDLIICRDCLVHLPTEFVHKALANLFASKARFVAITTFPQHHDNDEVYHLGGWRTLDLTETPYFLPEPDFTIAENCEEYGGVFRDKSLGVWALK
jgi:trans-aconitate methyltransferase